MNTILLKKRESLCHGHYYIDPDILRMTDI